MIWGSTSRVCLHAIVNEDDASVSDARQHPVLDGPGARAGVVARVVGPEHRGEAHLHGGVDHLGVVVAARRPAEAHGLAGGRLHDFLAGLPLEPDLRIRGSW